MNTGGKDELGRERGKPGMPDPGTLAVAMVMAMLCAPQRLLPASTHVFLTKARVTYFC